MREGNTGTCRSNEVGIELDKKPLCKKPKVQSMGHISATIGPMDLPIGPKDNPWSGEGRKMQKIGKKRYSIPDLNQ